MGVQGVKMVEVYPLTLLLCRKSSGEEKSVSVSRMATVAGLKDLARTAFGVEPTQPLTLWDHFDPAAAKLLSEESQTLTDAALQTGQQVRIAGHRTTETSSPLLSPPTFTPVP